MLSRPKCCPNRTVELVWDGWAGSEPRLSRESSHVILNDYSVAFDDFWIAWYTFAISAALAKQHGS